MIEVYAALNESGLLVDALKAKKEDSYYCCYCKQKVKLITTQSRIYFRHKNKCNNEINERLIHRKGKKILMNELSKLNLQSLKSEVYLSKIKQRPDILVNGNFAVEYQCAQINVDILTKRVNGYRTVGIKNIWILGGHYLKAKLGREHLKFITYNKIWRFYLLTLDSRQGVMKLFYNIEFIGPFNKLIYQVKVFPRTKFHKLFIFRPEMTQKSRIYSNKNWLKKIRKKNDLVSQKFKLDFYNARRMTVEEYLKKDRFEAEYPIFANPAWQRHCGQISRRLRQPLLKK